MFKNGQWKFLFWQKNRAIFGPFFGPKFGHFLSKIRFSDIFLETAHQICLKLGQTLGTIALYHLKTVLCPGKFLFWPFWPFWAKNTLLVVTLYGFGLFLAILFQTADDFLLIFVFYAKFIVQKCSIKVFVLKKNWGHFWTLFWS